MSRSQSKSAQRSLQSYAKRYESCMKKAVRSCKKRSKRSRSVPKKKVVNPWLSFVRSQRKRRSIAHLTYKEQLVLLAPLYKKVKKTVNKSKSPALKSKSKSKPVYKSKSKSKSIPKKKLSKKISSIKKKISKL